MEILGIDEVGRGSWAGPLVVGACVLNEPIDGLTDSKKLTARRREELNEIILAQSAWGLGWVFAPELDEIGLARALRKAAIEAASQIRTKYSEIVIDGTINFLAETRKGQFVTTLAKADLLIPAVSAASIIAKVARDRYMCEMAKKYPAYGFERHVGYGTKLHRQALLEHGACPEHRRSFRPIAELENIGGESRQEAKSAHKKSTSQIGGKAETKAAEYLTSLGHEIIVRNWRTPRCEIDIVSTFENRLYFVEVKYRRDSTRGDGLEAITDQKLRQMRFAAENFIKFRGAKKLSPRLAAISVAGADFQVQEFVAVESESS